MSLRLAGPQILVVTGLMLALASLSGCASVASATTADVAGIAGAGAATAVTKDAVVATGIGLGIAAGANAGLEYAERRVHGAEQDEIASVAGPLPPGGVATWSITHRIPLEDDEHGQLSVVRDLGNADFVCKEIVFSVDAGKQRDVPTGRAFYTATVCRDGQTWKWASAEPATERWGALQ
jgi:uncharacterized protein YceK